MQAMHSIALYHTFHGSPRNKQPGIHAKAGYPSGERAAKTTTTITPPTPPPPPPFLLTSARLLHLDTLPEAELFKRNVRVLD